MEFLLVLALGIKRMLSPWLNQQRINVAIFTSQDAIDSRQREFVYENEPKSSGIPCSYHCLITVIVHTVIECELLVSPTPGNSLIILFPLWTIHVTARHRCWSPLPRGRTFKDEIAQDSVIAHLTSRKKVKEV